MAYYGGRSYWKPYVPVAQRRRQAAQEARRAEAQGVKYAPVVISGRTIAKTYWGRAWCDNLEAYSDYDNRLPRGRTYVCNGSVIDLQVEAGLIQARVSGSSVYQVTIRVDPVPAEHWRAICQDCRGAIDSLVELLQGRFSHNVMERLCRQRTGLFPSPRDIHFSCSCPDWASMCKHVAAALYGVGVRLDEQPELLFLLRQVDAQELVVQVGAGVPLAHSQVAAERVLTTDDLEGLFGLELADAPSPLPAVLPAATSKAAKSAKNAQPAQPVPGTTSGKSRVAKPVRPTGPPVSPARSAKPPVSPAPPAKPPVSPARVAGPPVSPAPAKTAPETSAPRTRSKPVQAAGATPQSAVGSAKTSTSARNAITKSSSDPKQQKSAIVPVKKDASALLPARKPTARLTKDQSSNASTKKNSSKTETAVPKNSRGPVHSVDIGPGKTKSRSNPEALPSPKSKTQVEHQTKERKSAPDAGTKNKQPSKNLESPVPAVLPTTSAAVATTPAATEAEAPTPAALARRHLRARPLRRR